MASTMAGHSSLKLSFWTSMTGTTMEDAMLVVVVSRGVPGPGPWSVLYVMYVLYVICVLFVICVVLVGDCQQSSVESGS